LRVRDTKGEVANFMVFTSTVFMFMFLPLVIGGYFLVRKELRNLLLLMASLLFYAWGEPKFVLVMIVSIIINYVFGIFIHNNMENPQKKKLHLILCLVCNLGLLVFFKYANFIVHNLNALSSLMGSSYNINLSPIPLPIGISFFTFQGLSYVVDVYRKETKVQKNICDLALYISLFPQLIAGPIVRYHDVAQEIEKREITVSKSYYGVRRFIIGFAKKMLIANQAGEIADKIFAVPTNELTTAVAWLGIICYTLQIYYDFSGYSDMAIGLGKVFGFNFLENFNYPYVAKSIKEFWRRWHISLTTWFRDYLYIPLGGNRVSKGRTYVNQIIVFLLSGLWHGASWNFIFWGAYHGAFLVLERTPFEKFLKKLWAPIRHLYAIIVIMVGWVFFRAATLTEGWLYLKKMFLFTPSNNLHYASQYLNNKVILMLLAGIIFSVPVISYIKTLIEKNKAIIALTYVRDFILISIFLICLITLSSTTYNPFIYFRF
jgi:alginate O-acetyltransferase complex protein AlgI